VDNGVAGPPDGDVLVVGPAGDVTHRPIHHRFEVDGAVAGGEVAAAGPGQDQQVVGQALEPFHLVEDGVEGLHQLLAPGRPGPGQFQLAPHDRDGGAQLVAGVVEEAAFPGTGVLDAV